MAKHKANIKKRMFYIYICFIVLAIGLLLRTGYWQIVRGSWLKDEAEQQQMRDSVVTPKRGNIYDRNMNVLAQSASAYKVCVEPKLIAEEDNAEEVAGKLSEILGIEYDKVFEKTQKNSYYEIVAKKVEQPEADKIRELNLPGIRLDEDTKRYYPNGSLASHVIGFTGDDNQGLLGVELLMDSDLSGVEGRVKTAKSADGSDMPYEYEQYIDPIDGKDVVLSIDEVIQHFVEKHIENARLNNQAINGAVAIVMEPNTGEILAMTKKPDFDLNSPFTLVTDELAPEETEEETDLSTLLNRMWKNKAVVDTYEPGSTFKAIVAAIALEENIVSLNDTFVCNGSTKVADRSIRCHNVQGHGVQTFPQAVQNSCNCAFIEIGQRIGKDIFLKYFRAFGFGQSTNFDLPGEATGIYYNESNMTTIDLATNSFGQNFTATPLQMITAFSAIANGGELVTPHIVKQVLNADGSVAEEKQANLVRRVISEKTSETLRGIMEQVVSIGGGKNAYLKGFHVAGKTGTSEKLPRGNGEYIASFIGYAPADDPQVVVLVMLDTPTAGEYYGGTIAAPVAGKILEDTLKYLGVEPKYSPEDQVSIEKEMINVQSMNISDAQAALTNAGFTYNVVGNGNKVISQMPKAGTHISSGAICILYTEKTEDSKVIVPDVTQRSVSDCNYILVNSKLNFKITGPGKMGSNIVSISIYQEPAAGTEVAAGTVVNVEFRSGSSD